MSDTPRTNALVRFEFESTDQPFPAHALLAMMQLARQLERDLAAVTAERARWYRNPDGPEAADALEELKQRAERAEIMYEAERIHANLMRERLTECLALAEAMACSHNADGDYVSLSEAMAAYRAWREKL